MTQSLNPSRWTQSLDGVAKQLVAMVCICAMALPASQINDALAQKSNHDDFGTGVADRSSSAINAGEPQSLLQTLFGITPNPADQAGSLPAEFSVTKSGEATYQIPIQVTAGTAYAVPQLSLAYNSSWGASSVAHGWKLQGTLTVHSCSASRPAPSEPVAPETLISETAGQVEPTELCLNGSPLRRDYAYENDALEFLNGGEVQAWATVPDSQVRVISIPGGPYVYVIGADRFIHQLERAPSGKRSSSGADFKYYRQVATWPLGSGNRPHVEYEWHRGAGVPETAGGDLSRVTWYRADGNGENSIDFDYEAIEPSEQQIIETGHARMQLPRELRKIQVKLGATQTQESVTLTYDLTERVVNPRTGRGNLAAVQLCGTQGNGVEKTCLPATRFEYSGRGQSRTFGPGTLASQDVIDLSAESEATLFVDQLATPDLNGDGLADVTWRQGFGTSEVNGNGSKRFYRLSAGGDQPFLNSPRMLLSESPQTDLVVVDETSQLLPTSGYARDGLGAEFFLLTPVPDAPGLEGLKLLSRVGYDFLPHEVDVAAWYWGMSADLNGDGHRDFLGCAAGPEEIVVLMNLPGQLELADPIFVPGSCDRQVSATVVPSDRAHGESRRESVLILDGKDPEFTLSRHRTEISLDRTGRIKRKDLDVANENLNYGNWGIDLNGDGLTDSVVNVNQRTWPASAVLSHPYEDRISALKLNRPVPTVMHALDVDGDGSYERVFPTMPANRIEDDDVRSAVTISFIKEENEREDYFISIDDVGAGGSALDTLLTFEARKSDTASDVRDEFIRKFSRRDCYAAEVAGTATLLLKLLKDGRGGCEYVDGFRGWAGSHDAEIGKFTVSPIDKVALGAFVEAEVNFQGAAGWIDDLSLIEGVTPANLVEIGGISLLLKSAVYKNVTRPFWVNPEATTDWYRVYEAIHGDDASNVHSPTPGFTDFSSGDFNGDGIADVAHIQIDESGHFLLGSTLHRPVLTPALTTEAPKPDLLTATIDGRGTRRDISYKSARAREVSLLKSALRIGLPNDPGFAESCPTSHPDRVKCVESNRPVVHFAELRERGQSLETPRSRVSYMYGPVRVDTQSSELLGLGVSARATLEEREGVEVAYRLEEYNTDELVDTSGALQARPSANEPPYVDTSEFRAKGRLMRSVELRRQSWGLATPEWSIEERQFVYDTKVSSHHTAPGNGGSQLISENRFDYVKTSEVTDYQRKSLLGDVASLFYAVKDLSSHDWLVKRTKIRVVDHHGNTTFSRGSIFLEGRRQSGEVHRRFVEQYSHLYAPRWVEGNSSARPKWGDGILGRLLPFGMIETTHASEQASEAPRIMSGAYSDGSQLQSYTVSEFSPVGAPLKVTENPSGFGTGASPEWERRVTYSYCTEDPGEDDESCDRVVPRAAKYEWNEGNAPGANSPRERVEKFEDWTGFGPAKTLNALDHETNVTYHSAWGGPTTVQANGYATQSFAYDRLGRTSRISESTGGISEIHRRGPLAGSAANVATLVSTAANDGSASLVELDSFGREVRRLWRGFEGKVHESKTRHTSFRDGYQRQVELTTNFGEASLGTVYHTYDAQNRLVELTRPGNQEPVSIRHTRRRSGYLTEITRDDGTSLRLTDWAGRLVGTMDVAGTWRCFAYHINGRPIASWYRTAGEGENPRDVYCGEGWEPASLADAEAGISEWTYDFGDNVHVTSSAESGTTKSLHNANGQLIRLLKEEARIQEGSAAFQQYEYEYDEIGRPALVREPAGETRVWTWDVDLNGEDRPGRLGAVEQLRADDQVASVVSYRYDNLGRPVETSQEAHRYDGAMQIDSLRLAAETLYDDPLGRVSELRYPVVDEDATQFALKYHYDVDSGMLESIERDDVAVPGQNVPECEDAAAPWSHGGQYPPGAQVYSGSTLYVCSVPFPNSAWCSSFEPGTAAGQSVWAEIGACAGGGELWRRMTTDHRGNTVRSRIGEGELTAITQYWNYDPVTGRLRESKAARQFEDLTHFNYNFNPDGTLESRTDQRLATNLGSAAAPQTEKFVYNEKNELTSSWVESAAHVPYPSTVKAYDYDAFGNIELKGVDSSYEYGNEHTNPRSLIKHDGVRRWHDNRGRLRRVGALSMPDLSIDYDVWDQASTIVDAESETSLTYSALGAKLRRSRREADGSIESTDYFGGVFELVGLSEDGVEPPLERVRKYRVALDGGSALQVSRYGVGIAQFEESDAVLSDPMASTIAIVPSMQANATFDGRVLSYNPYGEARNAIWHEDGVSENTTPVDVGFGGHSGKLEGGLINMGARHYDPVVGRFTSPDPLIPGPSMVRAWNAYSFTFNSPPNFLDPTGMSPEGPFGGYWDSERPATPPPIPSSMEYPQNLWNDVPGYLEEFVGPPQESLAERRFRRSLEQDRESGSTQRTHAPVPRVGGEAQGGGAEAGQVVGAEALLWDNTGIGPHAQGSWWGPSTLSDAWGDVADSVATFNYRAVWNEATTYDALDSALAASAVVAPLADGPLPFGDAYALGTYNFLALRKLVKVGGVVRKQASKVGRRIAKRLRRRFGGRAARGAPAQSGAFGKNWKVIDESAGGAVGQTTGVSCGAACGEMVSGISQAKLMRTAGAPTDPGALAHALGKGWRGGWVGPEQLDAVMSRGPWIGEFFEFGADMGHFVVVQGRKNGNFVIRDPWEGGSVYQMAADEFHRLWTGRAVFK